VIGKSSESDVMATLPTLTFIDQSTLYTHRMWMSGLAPNVDAQGIEITANCIRPRKSCLTLSVPNHVLSEIDIALNYKISLDEVIGYLGNPDYVGYQLLGVETVTCEVELIWNSKQLVLTSDVFSWDSSNTKNNCVVVRDTGKTASSLIISKVSYKSSPWIEYMFSRDGSQYFKFSGTIPEK
jgi:hypothetical protein